MKPETKGKIKNPLVNLSKKNKYSMIDYDYVYNLKQDFLNNNNSSNNKKLQDKKEVE